MAILSKENRNTFALTKISVEDLGPLFNDVCFKELLKDVYIKEYLSSEGLCSTIQLASYYLS